MPQIKLRIKNQASIFLRGPGVSPAGPDMLEMLKASQDAGFDFIPSSFQQIDLQTGQIAARFKLSSPSTGLEILFPHERIDITLSPKDESGSNVGEYEDFLRIVNTSLEFLAPAVKRKFYRMSAISEILLDANEEELKRAYDSTIRAGELHSAHPPYEWNARVVSRIPSKSLGEGVNIISNLSRVSGGFRTPSKTLEFDTLHWELDLNTSQKDDTERFTAHQFMDFLAECCELMQRVSAERLSNF